MDLKLRNKLAVVTGSTGDGIGHYIAQELAQQGATVVVNGRSQKTVNDAVNAILTKLTISDTAEGPKSNNDRVIGIPGDVGSKEGCDAFIAALEGLEKKLNQPVDILINNVGIFHSQDFVNVSDDKWIEYYQMNTMSGVRLSRHFLPEMLKRNTGRILFVSSECGLRPLPHMLPYSVSKTSQLSLSRGLAEMTKGSSVTVNCILPGPTMTGGVRSYMKDFARQNDIDNFEEAVSRYFKEFEPTSLLQRFLDPQEVAAVAVFLASPLASGINGTAQHVDGGIVRHLS